MQVLREVCALKNLTWIKKDWRYPLKSCHVNGSDFIFISDFDSEKNNIDSFPGRKFHVVRDPRDILVSMYFSHRDSHEENTEEIIQNRKQLQNTTVIQGLHYLFDHSKYFQRIKREFKRWDYERGDTLDVRFEDLVKQPTEKFDEIFQFVRIPIEKAELEQIMEKLSFDSLKQKSTKHAGHYRSGREKEWAKYFDEALKEKFHQEMGEVLRKFKYD
jgi:hypothetical protein